MDFMVVNLISYRWENEEFYFVRNRTEADNGL